MVRTSGKENTVPLATAGLGEAKKARGARCPDPGRAGGNPAWCPRQEAEGPAARYPPSLCPTSAPDPPTGGRTNLRGRGLSPGRKTEPAGGVSRRLGFPGRGRVEHAAAAAAPLPPPGQRTGLRDLPVPPPGRLPAAPRPRLRPQPSLPRAGHPAPGKSVAGAHTRVRAEGCHSPEGRPGQ